MKQSLQLRLGQHLTMTPQLQQAIRLLQLSTLELRLEVQQALDSNLMLELDEEEAETEPDGLEGAESGDDPAEAASGDDLDIEREDIPDDLPVDSAWDDIYDNVSTGPAQGDHEERDYEHNDASREDLRDHLRWQLRMSPMGERDMAIAEMIIDSINDDGYLTEPLEMLRDGLDPELEVEPEEMEAVLHAVQNLDPAGVAARDVRESLLLQVRAMPEDTPWLEAARTLIRDHFDLLADRDFNQLKRRMKLGQEELGDVVRLIQRLNPRPGSLMAGGNAEYVIPDVMVRKHKGAWRVELNPEAAPRLRINTTYADLIKRVNNTNDSTYLKNHLQEARWFLKSLASRNETLLKVATCIIEHQREFLEKGEVAMKPLVLHDVAQEVEMHESTISRVTTRKYMHTPRGIFELKYFFSSHVGTADGGECSSTAIRALIKAMIAEETPAKPLSDSKIAESLKEKGINVARRTVAKYREAMAIPPSNERKRLA